VHTTAQYVGHSVKKLLIPKTKKKRGGSYKASLLIWSENKKGIIQEAILLFI
jgi:hypothetical protein